MPPIKAVQKRKKKSQSKRVSAIVVSPRIRARYDAAQTTVHNRRHWAYADGLSADAANNPGVLRTLRERATYECDNNSYARGIVETLANDTIGTGPRGQIRGLTKEAAREIESAFRDWCDAIRLTEILRVMRKAKTGRGESFVIKTTNERLPTPVKLDLQLIEADRCASPNQSFDNQVDGIELDSGQRPAFYHFLKEHPGGNTFAAFNDTFRVPADLVIHYFRKDRPDQHHGIPEITPALPLYAMLRRYTLAVLDSAETAANHSMFIKTGAMSSMVAEDADADAWAEFPLERNTITALPWGYEPFQLDAKQPTNTYKEFKAEILNEIARCLNMPFNIAAGNSSGYNYSSGRLDHQTYYKSIDVERSHIVRVILRPIFDAWLQEAIKFRTFTEEALAQLETVNDRPTVQWFWDGMKHVDPAKEATAQATRLANKTATYADECANDGKDWEEQFEQMAAEQKRAAELGLILVAPPKGNEPAVVEDEAEGDDEA